MNPNLEPQLYAVVLFISILFFILFRKRIAIPTIHPILFFVLIALEYLFFTAPMVQKQLVDFGVANVVISPFTVAGALIFLSALIFLRIPTWLIAITIIPLTFYVGEMAYYDATHIIGPIHDLLVGKLPLSSPSWYGLMPIVLLSFVFRMIPLSLFHLYLVIAVIETLGYLLLYLFVLRLYKDTKWANLTILLIILFHFLVQLGDRNYYLQSTFIRFGIWLPLAFSILANNRRAIIGSLLLALFWTTDMGLYVVGAYIAALLITRKPVWPIVRVIAPAAFILLLFPNYWQFSLSYGTIPMFAKPIPLSPFPWLYLVVPIITLLTTRDLITVYVSLLCLFMFTYFTGHSHLNALRIINVPLIIVSMWWLKKLPRYIPILILIIPVAVWGNQAVQNLKRIGFQKPVVSEYSIVGPTALEIQNRYQSVLTSEDFALISPWDSYYLLIWNTTNPLGSNCLLCYWTPEAAKKLTDTMKNLRVSYIFVDRERLGYEGRVSWIFDPIAKHYQFVETIGDLDVYTRL